MDDTAATLRIHFGKARGRNSAVGSALICANGTAVSTQRINRFRCIDGETRDLAAGTISSTSDIPSRLRQNVKPENRQEQLSNLRTRIEAYHVDRLSIVL